MALTKSDAIAVLGKGVYSIAEAARLTELRAGKVREWFRGRKSPSRVFKSVFQSDYPTLNDEYAISFLDLIELKVAGNLRDAGISMQYLRKVYAHLEGDFGDHPFCVREIYVGGKQVFTRGLNQAESSEVIEAITRQAYFDKIIMPFLKKIDYDDVTRRALRWHIADMVVVDPAIRFGKPVIEGVGIATSVLSRAYFANGEDEESVARWFSIDAKHVKAAVEFESRLAA